MHFQVHQGVALELHILASHQLQDLVLLKESLLHQGDQLINHVQVNLEIVCS